MSVRSSRGRWIIDVNWPDSTRSRLVMPTEEDADKLNLRIRAARVDGTWRRLRDRLNLRRDRPITFSDFAKVYEREYVKVYNRAPAKKMDRVRQLEETFGGLPLESISERVVNRHIQRRKRKGISNATLNRDLAALRHMLRWAARQRLISRKRVRWLADLERFRESVREHPRATDKALSEIFAKLDPRVAPLFTFLRETGCRREEALSLQHSQVDWSRLEVTFSGNTKSGKARTVPLTDAAAAAIEAMPKAPGCDCVFYNPDTLRRWHDCRKPWETARTVAGQVSVRIKDLRSAFAIRLAEAGTPMHAIQKVLGHASVTTTECYYAKYSPESASAEVRRRLILINGGGLKTGTK